MKLLMFLNRNSLFVLATVLIFAIVWGFRTSILVAGTALIVTLLGLYAIYKRSVVPERKLIEQTPVQAAGGKFALVEFYSDY